jgi:chromosome segregation ATPase
VNVLQTKKPSFHGASETLITSGQHFPPGIWPTLFRMNALGFFLHRLAWQFGIRNERNRWNAVTRETQTLSEAQDILGRLCWPETGEIDELTGEYWQIRDKHDSQAKLRGESDALQDRLDQLQEDLEGIESRYDGMVAELLSKKDAIMDRAAVMNEAVDEIRDQDIATRSRFSSLKNKLDVLKKQEDASLDEEIEKTRLALVELKSAHEESKKLIEEKELEVKAVEESVGSVEQEIASKREQMKAETESLVAEIGRGSKSVAEYSARIGALENAKTELSFRIGQFLSQNLDSENPEIRKVLGNHRSIISKIIYLKRSIQYNTRLARRAGR